ncbi:plant acid phosphatase [Legionella massiliensis]|uniref:Plant acid phosphatase n=1 Tax=Legionella massiliensis TaxID=1034943 RepID=A0A078KVH4_9GAMM|nr:HAD family acid phosphatase [Legionella massiliensis]CDZ76986.1 plant acid phosphatase [Legionella massiliensis]CEE12724.1 HAD superfamily, subfamily IIIB (Acid phosphatase) [Legionella massiliensis]
MNTLSSQFFTLLSGIAFLSATAFAEPSNLGLLKNDIKTYHDSGLYEKELTKAILNAQNYILKQAKLNERCYKDCKKLAIVLDIDETSLSNYDKMVKRDFVANKEQLHKEMLAANSPVISPMLKLYTDAREQGIQVFFVTGRPQSELKATETNLLRAGYKGWAGLYLRPNNYKQPSIVPFKSQARKLISEQGYTILASIGDQYSDIKGGYCQKGFKLPNPYYYLP